MSAPLTRTSAFTEVQDGDGAGGAGPTLERVELILAKWKYIYIYMYFKTLDILFQWHVSKKLLNRGWIICIVMLLWNQPSIPNFRYSIDIEFGPEGESVSRVKRKCFTIAEIAHHFCVSQFAVFEKNLTVISFFKIWLQSKRSKHEMATCSSA